MRNTLLLDATIFASGAGTFFLANIELITASMIAFATFVVTVIMRASKHRSEMETERLQRKQERELHEQELKQRAERHEIEMKLLTKSNNNDE